VRAFLLDLEDRGLLDAMACERAAAVQAQTGQRIDDVLSQLGLITDATLLEALAHFFQLQLVTLDVLPPEPVLAEVLGADFLRRNRVVPLQADERQVAVAVADPFAHDILDAIAYHVERPVVAALASRRNIDLALSRLYGLADGETAAQAAPHGASGVGYEDDIQRLRDMASEAPIIRLVHRLIASAVGQSASDIHIEPAADSVDRELEAVRSRFASPSAYEATLARSGFDEKHLRETIRQELRLRAYLDQRFTAADPRRQALVDEWLTGLRRRGNVVDLYLPGR
jgi:general secretion pathway protein E